MKVGTAFSCGVPLLAEGKVSVEVTANYEFTYGTTGSVAKTISGKNRVIYLYLDSVLLQTKAVVCNNTTGTFGVTVPSEHNTT